MILKNKKGITIVEVVIAMTVIAIVSATALSIVLASGDNTRAALYKSDAQYLVADAIECYKVSDEKDELVDALLARGGLVLNSRGENNGVFKAEFTMEDSGYFVFVTMSTPITMSIEVRKDGNHGELVASASYIRAGR